MMAVVGEGQPLVTAKTVAMALAMIIKGAVVIELVVLTSSGSWLSFWAWS